MTRHPLHLIHAQSLAVRGAENLVIGREYLKVHLQLWGGDPASASAVSIRLLAMGGIGFRAEDAMRRGDMPLDRVKPLPPDHDDLKLVFEYTSRVEFPIFYRSPRQVWYASDAGVIPYPTGYNKVNFILDFHELNRRGISVTW